MYSLATGLTAADVIGYLLGLLGILVAWYGHKRIGAVEKLKARLQMEVEQFKAALIGKHDAELEKLRADLRVVSHEREVAISSLQTERAKVIKDLYSNLVATEDALAALTSLIETSEMPSKDERASQFTQSFNEFRQHSDTHRIYFDESLCNELEEYKQSLKKTYYDFYAHILVDKQSISSESIEKWFKCAQDTATLIPELRFALEREFRCLLGVTKSRVDQYHTTEPAEKHGIESLREED